MLSNLEKLHLTVLDFVHFKIKQVKTQAVERLASQILIFA